MVPRDIGPKIDLITTSYLFIRDLRARLELAVDHIFDACSHVECATDTDCSTTTSIDGLSEGMPEYLMSSPAITAVVRKELAPAIRDLMQHGLNQVRILLELYPTSGLTQSITYTGWSSFKFGPLHELHVQQELIGQHVGAGSCLGRHSSILQAEAGPILGQTCVRFDLIMTKLDQYLQGHEYNSAPQRKLSQSFGLDLAGASSNVKQSLLATVGQIIASHGQYKRSADAHFKAFVCAGLK